MVFTVNTIADVTLIGALAAIWLTAGLLADGFPAATTAAALRRRATLLVTLIVAGSAVFVAIPLADNLLPGTSAAPMAALLVAAPALVVLTTTLRRLTWIRRGAGAFATAPQV